MEPMETCVQIRCRYSGCKTIFHDAVLEENICLNRDLQEIVNKSDEKTNENSDNETESGETEFLRAVNTLMNEKGGAIIIHACDPELLDTFDQKMDDKLKLLIPDDTFYHQWFERIIAAPNHVIFRVKRVSGERRFSTYNFCTKLSLDKGLGDPTLTQLRGLCAAAPSVIEPSDEPVLPGEENGIPFQESLRVEAKDVKRKCSEAKDKNRKRRKTKHETVDFDTVSAEYLANYVWDKADLDKYISAYSKIPGGGFLLFGVNEKAERGKKIYTCLGFALPEDKQAELKDVLIAKCQEKLLWYGAERPEAPIDVTFRKVPADGAAGHSEEKFVVQVRIDYYYCLCFYRPPLSFRWLRPQLNKAPQIAGTVGDRQIENIDVEEWVYVCLGNKDGVRVH